jgi:hypothetical protein
MGLSLSRVLVGMFAAACALAAPAGHAFTVENKDATGEYAVPKFDLEEQSKNFRKAGAASPGDKGDYSIPLGSGSLQFGVTPGSAFNTGSVFSPQFGPAWSAQTSRQEFDRRLAPPTSLEYSGVR